MDPEASTIPPPPPSISPITSVFLSFLSAVPGEIAAHVNVPALEAAVLTGLAGGIPGIFGAIVSNSSKIFRNPVYATQAVRLLEATEAVVTHPEVLAVQAQAPRPIPVPPPAT